MKDPFLEDLWRRSVGLPERYNTELVDYHDISKSEWNPEFASLMKNRLVMGVYRGYGLLGAPDKPSWNRIDRAIYELEQYRNDGNDERLVDVANMSLLEFTEGNHPRKHYKALDDVFHTTLK
jgi:hypothetical protein